MSRRHAIRFQPAGTRSCAAFSTLSGNSPVFADMFVVEPTAKDYAAMRQFRRKARLSIIYSKFILLIYYVRRIAFTGVCI